MRVAHTSFRMVRCVLLVSGDGVELDTAGASVGTSVWTVLGAGTTTGLGALPATLYWL